MNQHPSPLFRVEDRLQRADYVARAIALSRRLYVHPLAVALGYLSLLLLLLLWQAGSPEALVADLQRRLAAPALPDNLPWLLPALPLLFPPSLYAAIFSRLAFRRHRLAGAGVTIDVTTGGLVVAAQGRASRLAWKAIRRLVGTPGFPVLQHGRPAALNGPRRSLGDPATYASLVGFNRARPGLSTGR